MDKEIVIPRKKTNFIWNALLFLVLTFMFICNCTVNVAILFDSIDALEKAPWLVLFALPTPIGLLCGLCAPLTFLVGIDYFKKIFIPHPLLTVNTQGIDEHMSRKPVGLILWEDIEDIHIVPYMGKGNYWIAIFLKNPQKYIQDEQRLAKTNKTAAKGKLGHIFFCSLDFKKQTNEVVALIRYYFEKSRAENDTFA